MLAKGCKSMLSGEDKEISLAGGRFTFAHELWVDRSTLDLDCPPIGSVDPLNPRRYDDGPLQNLAVIAKLYVSLLPELRGTLVSKDRGGSFKEIVSPNTSFHHPNYSPHHISS